jgi:hypothetical protein
LVHQRVTQQNEASLIQFTVKIIYDDDSSILLNSFEDFSHYNEIRPIASVAAHLTWIYLIRFPGSKTPEKQVIEVGFLAPPKSSIFGFDDDDDAPLIHPIWMPTGLIRTEISHTARTWGVDIDSLLEGHIKTFSRKQGALRRWITRHSERVGLLAGIFFLVATYIAGYRAANSFLNEQLIRLQNFVSPDGAAPGISEKLDFMLQLIAEGGWARFSFFVGMSAVFLLVFAIVFGVVVGTLAENRPSSFVVLSQQAAARKNETLRKEQRRWLSFLGSVSIDFLAALAAHSFFSHFLSKMLH